jgi:hypothetical protein
MSVFVCLCLELAIASLVINLQIRANIKRSRLMVKQNREILANLLANLPREADQ